MTISAEHRLFESYLVPALKSAYGVAYYLTLNSGNAENLVREASLRAYRAFSTFKAGSNFKAWFLHILLRQFTERSGAKGRGDETILSSAYGSVGSKDSWIASGSAPIATDALNRIASQQVIEALATLPEPYRIACAIYFVDNLTYREIAEIIECPVEVVRERIHGGRNLLKTTLCQWNTAPESAPMEITRAHHTGSPAIG